MRPNSRHGCLSRRWRRAAGGTRTCCKRARPPGTSARRRCGSLGSLSTRRHCRRSRPRAPRWQGGRRRGSSPLRDAWIWRFKPSFAAARRVKTRLAPRACGGRGATIAAPCRRCPWAADAQPRRTSACGVPSAKCQVPPWAASRSCCTAPCRVPPRPPPSSAAAAAAARGTAASRAPVPSHCPCLRWGRLSAWPVAARPHDVGHAAPRRGEGYPTLLPRGGAGARQRAAPPQHSSAGDAGARPAAPDRGTGAGAHRLAAGGRRAPAEPSSGQAV